MRICPACGADILDSATVRCSSCGTNLQTDAKPDFGRDRPDYGRDRPDYGRDKSDYGPDKPEYDGDKSRGADQPTEQSNQQPLDDSAPIASADGLELVKEGTAFWEESRAHAEEVRSKQRAEFEAQEKERQEHADDSHPEDPPKRSSVIDISPGTGPAPSLADLARTRRRALTAETGEDDTDREDDTARESGSAGDRDEATDSDREFDSDADREFDSDGDREVEKDTDKVTTIRSTVHYRVPDEEMATDEQQDELARDDTDPEGVEAKASEKEVLRPEPTVNVISRSPDVAFIDGSSLYIPGSHWTPGETVVLQGKTFQLKRKVNKYPISPRLAAFAGGGFVMGCLLMALFFAGDEAPTGNIFGVVREGGSGNLLPGVTVAIEDHGQTSESDPAGMFAFRDLEEGIYTLVATDPIYGKQRQTVTVSEGSASVLLDLQREQIAVSEPPRTQPKPSKPKPQSSSTTSSGRSTSRAKLAVTASVPNAKIFLDGKMLGVGNAVYTGIRPGNRNIRVEYEGFKPWVRNVDIKGGQTNRIEPKLTAIEPSKPDTYTPEQYATAGRQLLKQRQYKLAVEQFSMAIEGSKRAQFYVWRADAYAGLKQLRAAEGDYLAAMNLFQRSGEDTKLDDMLERAVLVVPASAPLRMAYADYLYSRRKLNAAIKSYRKAVELGADQARAYVGIGLSQYAGGSFEEAAQNWTYADDATGNTDPHIAGYLALVNARLQYRASCRNAVRRLLAFPDVLQQFRGHPDWERVRHLTGEG